MAQWRLLKTGKEFTDKVKLYRETIAGMNFGTTKDLLQNISKSFSEYQKGRSSGGGNYFADMLPPSKGFICWDKRVYNNMTNDFADCEYAYLSDNMGVARMFRFIWNGMLQGNMKDKEERIHPTQKPIALYDWIAEKYCKKGYKILDTHVGSGSSLIAYARRKLDFVGFEIDKEYYRKAKERFEVETAQTNIFDYI